MIARREIASLLAQLFDCFQAIAALSTLRGSRLRITPTMPLIVFRLLTPFQINMLPGNLMGASLRNLMMQAALAASESGTDS
jgi:hypothetical protein